MPDDRNRALNIDNTNSTLTLLGRTNKSIRRIPKMLSLVTKWLFLLTRTG
jgi:hypothetical protein